MQTINASNGSMHFMQCKQSALRWGEDGIMSMDICKTLLHKHGWKLSPATAKFLSAKEDAAVPCKGGTCHNPHEVQLLTPLTHDSDDSDEEDE